MLKTIIKIIRKIIMAFLILYGLNVMLAGLNFYLPINVITVGAISLLGAPGLLGLILMVFIL